MRMLLFGNLLLLIPGFSLDPQYQPDAPQPIPGSKNYGQEFKPRPFTERPTEDSGSMLGQLMGGMIPNSYYSRPALRFPYYDKNGKGYLLYGYGGKELFEYTTFDMLEGWF